MSEGSESRLLAGRYRLRDRLGRGGMATVYRATDELLGRDVAVKLLDLHTSSDDSARARFRREARATAALSHTNIVTVFDTGVDGDDAFLVMELLPGPTLAEEIRERGQLSVAEVIRIGVQVSNALAAAHAGGIVHRDIKPGNIARTADGSVKVLDFGITQLLDESLDTAHGPLTVPDSVIGTAQYLSPEQATGQRVDHRADLYALGCVLFALLAGRAPFKGDTAVATLMLQTMAAPPDLHELRPDVPPALAELIAQLLAKDPAARPASAQAVADRLRRLSTHVPTLTPHLPGSALTAATTVLPATEAVVGAAGLQRSGAADFVARAVADDGGVIAVAGTPGQEPAELRGGGSRRTSPAGPIAIVVLVLLLAGAGLWALLHFRPGIATPPASTHQSTPSTEPSTLSPPDQSEPPKPTPTGESVTPKPATTPAPPTTAQPSISSPATLPEVQAVMDEVGRFMGAVAAAVNDGTMTKEDRKSVTEGLRALDQAVKKEDPQRASDAMSEIDQALSDSGGKGELQWWYDQLKVAVDAWTETLP